jgi:drug/metabolite transporter (DMT)-like permease
MKPLLGILLQILASLAFTFQGAFARYLGESVPLGQMVFARSSIALVPLIIMLAWQGKLGTITRTRNIFAHVTRSFTNVGGMFFNYAGFTRIPLADATAIGYAMPLFTVILAAMFLGEVVRIWRWCAVFVGLLGVFVMLSPHVGHGAADTQSALGALFCLVAALLFGIAMTQVRHMSATETTASLVFYYSVIASLVSLTTLYWGWIVPSWDQLAVLIGLGICGGIAQILMTESFRYAAASVLAPFSYVSMIWAVMIGFLWFGEVPELIVLAGAIIVIGSGLFVIWRERRLGIEHKRAQAELTPPNEPKA